MTKKIFLILILIEILISCNSSSKEEKLECSSIDYSSSININSKIKLDSCALLIQYAKGNIDDVKDTTNVILNTTTSNQGNFYKIIGNVINTSFDYQIVFNDSLRYFITDIITQEASHGMDFMGGTKKICEIFSYKINGKPKNHAQIYIEIESL